MWYQPEERFRLLVIRKAADGDVVAVRVMDSEKYADREAMEIEFGRESVKLAAQHGVGHEIFEATCASPRPLLGEWWRGRPRLRFLVVRRKGGRKDLPVRKFLDASKYRNEDQFDAAVGAEKDKLLDRFIVSDYDVMEIEAANLDDFKRRFPDLAR